jgi:VanZ family protein
VPLGAYNITRCNCRSRAQRVVRWSLVVAYGATIFWLSSLPARAVPTLKTSDKLLHAVEFGGLAFLVCRALRAQTATFSLRRVAVVSVLMTMGYGITDEFHQFFVAGRRAEVADLAADSLGALLVAWGWVRGSVRWPWLQ